MQMILKEHGPELTIFSDMGNIEVGWDVDGIISAEESVKNMLRVIESKDVMDSGKFFTWEGRVSISLHKVSRALTETSSPSHTLGSMQRFEMSSLIPMANVMSLRL